MRHHGPVVLFCGGLAGDGVARNTVHLGNALCRRGVDVEVIALDGGALAADLRGPRLTLLGSSGRPRAMALAAAVPALTSRLVRLRPSMVVSMGNHAHLAVWAALRGLDEAPRIYRISNDPTHGRSRLREAGLRLIAADATRLVCVSAAIASADVFRRARRDRRLDVLPNGVDATAVQARAGAAAQCAWLADPAPYVVAVGRLHPQKNYEALLEAVALARAHGLANLRLLILGGGPSRRRAALAERAQALGLGGAFSLPGEVANPFPLLSRAAAFVLPSLWEGASNSLLEALACGVPVVAATTAGNAREVLGGGRYGVLAAPEPQALADAIVRQARPETRILPGERAGDYALEAVTDRFCAIVLGAASAHDEIQMMAEGGGHVGSLSGSLRGPHKEY